MRDGNVSINVSAGKAYVTQTWHSGSNGYRKWSDGYIEQWGFVNAYGNNKKISFHTAFTISPPIVNFIEIINANTDGNSSGHWVKPTPSTTSFVTQSNKFGGNPTLWYAIGY